MNSISNVGGNAVFLAALAGWILSQTVKVGWTAIKHRRFDVERIMGSGGMPSAHSASVMAGTFACGERLGYGSPLFGFAMVVSFIVMYDAANVRMAAGKQAKVINKIIKEIGHHKLHMDEELKELLGHTYLEVLVGAGLGVLLGILIG